MKDTETFSVVKFLKISTKCRVLRNKVKQLESEIQDLKERLNENNKI